MVGNGNRKGFYGVSYGFWALLLCILGMPEFIWRSTGSVERVI